jgi:hypothetical protein
MLEYLLIRPYERELVGHITSNLQFLVMDELHVYRGRQGADIAMLLRRVQARAAGRSLQFIGTSATLATAGTRQERNEKIAEVGSTLFGVKVPSVNVVDETLMRVTSVPAPRTRDELRAAVTAPAPATTRDAVTQHPLSAWIEDAFGLTLSDEERLVRKPPATFSTEVTRLTDESGLGRNECEASLMAVLAAGTSPETAPPERPEDPVFAFRLHQFIASGSSIYATIEPPDDREFFVHGQYVAPGSDDGTRLLYPLTFCRECGQEYYQVSLLLSEGRLLPRSPLPASWDETEGTQGYLAIQRDGLWSHEDTLPEFWFEDRKVRPLSPRHD